MSMLALWLTFSSKHGCFSTVQSHGNNHRDLNACDEWACLFKHPTISSLHYSVGVRHHLTVSCGRSSTLLMIYSASDDVSLKKNERKSYKTSWQNDTVQHWVLGQSICGGRTWTLTHVARWWVDGEIYIPWMWNSWIGCWTLAIALKC